MLRFRGAAIVIVAITIAMLAGCGGGGGSSSGSNNNVGPDPGGGTTTPVSSTVTITGKVVSSADATKGVANVVVSYAGGYGATNSNGAYSITFDPRATELPYNLTVNTSAAGTAFPVSQFVSLEDGQKYDPDLVDVPLAVLNGDATVLPTIVVYDVSQGPPGAPYASKNNMVFGRVIRESNGSGIVNATIKLGDPDAPALTVKTGKRGYFAINLGRDVSLLDVVGVSPSFSVDVTTATGFDGTYRISYGTGAGSYFQNQSISIPTESDISDETPTIGLIMVLDLNPGGDGGDGGGGNPPPPPPF